MCQLCSLAVPDLCCMTDDCSFCSETTCSRGQASMVDIGLLGGSSQELIFPSEGMGQDTCLAKPAMLQGRGAVREGGHTLWSRMV